MNRYFLTIFFLIFSINLYAEDKPKCHLYLLHIGWVDNVRGKVLARYDNEGFCNGLLKGYPCFSYFESKDNCSTSDKSLVDLFLKDADLEN